MRPWKKAAVPALSLFFIFLLWSGIYHLGIFSSYVLPSPAKVWESFLKMVMSGEIFQDIAISFGRVLKGFSIAFALAFVLGMFRYLFPALDICYEYLLQFFRNVPPISMIPLLILWCGIGETTKIIIIVLAAFFPIYLNIVKGFTGCDQRLLEVGAMFGYSPLRSFFRIVLPSAGSDILVGMRIGLGYGWRAIIGAEMVAASTGLGHQILFAQQMSRTDRVIVGIFTIGVVGLITDRLFGWVIKKVLKGSYDNGWT